MKKILLLFLAFSLWSGGMVTQAQNKPVPNGKDPKKLAEDLRLKYQAKREKALQLAKEKNWKVLEVLEDGTVISLQGVDESGLPIYYTTDNNTRAAASTRTNELWNGGLLGLNLSGSNPALAGKLGIWDGGALRPTHQELSGRTVNRDGSATLSDHATHVAGTMIAKGANPLAKGMSHGAPNIQSWDFNVDVPEMAAAAPGLLISNHSYGSISGWRLNTSNNVWEFWGRFNENEDFKFGLYSSETLDFDAIAYNNPDYLIVKSAGNNRSQNGPAVGASYSRFNAQGIMAPAGARPAGISNNDGYDIISTYGTAKNILTVAAVEPIPGSYQQESDVKISSFSSWGPTDDGRIKPDISGNGVALLSSIATANDAYASYNGTSMSAPNVSGSLNLLQEHYHNLTSKFMRSATLKALAIHTADEAGTAPGPDYIYGWGLLNASRAARVISNGDKTHLLQEKTLAQGATETIEVTASGAGPLVVTITWTDPEGAATSLLNDRTPRLVNDLDLRISGTGETFMPWILNPDSPASAATRGDNFRDNVEQVLIANAVPGEKYTITVTHKGTLARGPQAYSIIASGIGGQAVCASVASANDDSKIVNVSFGSINNTPATGCTTYSNFTSIITSLQQGQLVPLKLSLGSCGANFDKIAKVFIDWNANGTFEAGEEVAQSGVIPDAADFEAMVQVPSTVEVGKIARMRVVLVETSNSSDVAACGAYAKGETQDYLVRFVRPANDLGIASLVSPDNGICANPAQGGVAVLVRNFGTSAQMNVPLTVVITRSNGSEVATLNGTTRTVPALSEAVVTLPGTFEAIAGETYTFTASVSLNTDANQANNQLVAQRKVSAVTAAPVASATICGTDPASLRGSGDGTIFWYDAPTGGNLIAAGNNTYTSFKPADKTYYAALNQFSGKVGLVSKDFTGSGGGYNQFGPTVSFTAQVPFVIEKARLYIGNSGTITFTVSTPTGNPVSSVTLDVTATRTTPGPNAQPNDLNDKGAIYDLNLAVPAPGNYLISIEYGNGATIYRNNAGVTGANAYPYTVPGVMSITTSSAGTAAYYYLYDIQLKALGCPSPRVAVVASEVSEATATITPAGSTNLCLGQTVVLNGGGNGGNGMTYQWFLNGAAIANATSNSFEASQAGNYTLMVTNADGCRKTSTPVAVTVSQLPTVYNIAAASSTELCVGEAISVLLRATSDITTGITYRWFKDQTLIPGATAATYTATSTGSYTVEYANTICGAVTATPVVITQGTPELTVADAVICNATGSTELQATSNFGTIFWYDAPTGGKLLDTGSTYTTPQLYATTSYYAGLNDFSGSIGAPSLNTGGGQSNFNGGRMYFDAEVPFMLEKATINVGAAGTMTVIIVDKDFSNTIIASRTINVTVGVNEYEVNLFVPKAGKNYGFQVSTFGGGAAAYRNNTGGTVNFPYAIPGVMSITGTNQADQTAFYYFLYNWKVKATGCAITERKKVDAIINPAPVASAVTNKSTVYFGYAPEATATLTASATSGKAPYTYLWSNGATTATIAVSPTSTTTYTVTVTDALGCKSTATTITVNVVDVRCGNPSNPKVQVCMRNGRTVCIEPGDVPNQLRNGATLGSCRRNARESTEEVVVEATQIEAYPNPFSKSIIIEIVPEVSGTVTYEIYTLQGVLVQRLYAGEVEAGKLLSLQFNGSHLSNGIYVGKFVSGTEVKNQKLILQR